jgi:predicted HicB family RNase H-like nuclease
MKGEIRLRFVVDTNVIFEGLTKTGGAPGLLIEAWLAGLYHACVSNSLAYEYVDMLYRKLSMTRWQRLQPVVGALLSQARFVTAYYAWRPISVDPGDDHVIDCAMNAGAAVVTWNVRDYRAAQQGLGLVVRTPVEAVTRLAEEERWSKMGRLTVRLPQTLHNQLVQLAEVEGVSLNQYVIYSLARQAALAYTVQPTPEAVVAEQRAAFTALLQQLGQASFSEVQAALAEREPVEPETGLTPEVIQRLRTRIAATQQVG